MDSIDTYNLLSSENNNDLDSLNSFNTINSNNSNISLELFNDDTNNNPSSEEINDIIINNITDEHATHKTKKKKIKEHKPFYKLNLLEIVLGIKNTVFDIINELINSNYSTDVFIKGNRLFFIGIIILLFIILLYVYDYFFSSNKSQISHLLKNDSVVEIHHIYKKV